jgi:hypothetical protein
MEWCEDEPSVDGKSPRKGENPIGHDLILKGLILVLPKELVGVVGVIEYSGFNGGAFAMVAVLDNHCP